tara:strand:+ start:166 stop:420 length:255 start_codon:yes stop_codon:yes gene_type:complete
MIPAELACYKEVSVSSGENAHEVARVSKRWDCWTLVRPPSRRTTCREGGQPCINERGASIHLVADIPALELCDAAMLQQELVGR